MNTTIQEQQHSWQLEIKHAIRNAHELLTYLHINPEKLATTDTLNTNFPCRVPLSFVKRMIPGDPNDPLLRQVLPLAQEETTAPGYSKDPLKETKYLKVPGLIHKYHGRVLITLTSACAIHCRYCFRRHFDYHGNYGQNHQQQILEYLKIKPSIHEVILSGGDPLSISDDKLEQWLAQLSKIPHIKRLRIHSRLPVVIPTRITPKLCQILQQSRFDVIFVLHINHPNELAPSTYASWKSLKQTGIVLLNQSVLLKGINDQVNILQELSEKMVHLGILPYYLHQLDPVLGAQHFFVPLHKAKKLYQSWQRIAPGYMLPRFVADIPHKPHKTILNIVE